MAIELLIDTSTPMDINKGYCCNTVALMLLQKLMECFLGQTSKNEE
jgi:hypothetical protein